MPNNCGLIDADSVEERIDELCVGGDGVAAWSV
jgi:hypothetical protein